jgi:multisubunit Na+/H+ antiporter MnhF subunit
MNLFKHHNAAALHQSGSKMNDNDTIMGVLKIIIAWIVATFSSMSERVMALDLAHWVQVVALVFTLAQMFFLIRDKWWRDRKRRRGNRRAQYDRSSTDKTRA